MADKHPYIPAPGGLVRTLNQFRQSVPAEVTAETIKKFGFAPKNEGFIVNTLRWLGFVDEEGKSTELAKKVFTTHQDDAFHKAFAEVVKKAYSGLFSLHGEEAWNLDSEALVTYFRQTDQSSGITGKRQASAFQTLIGFAGHGEVPTPRKRRRAGKTGDAKKVKKAAKAAPKSPSQSTAPPAVGQTVAVGDYGLTVRIEVNLPAEGDQATYDRIFKSIRQNLLNG